MICNKVNEGNCLVTKTRLWFQLFLVIVLLFHFSSVFSQELKLKITKPYLNIPIGSEARMKLAKISVKNDIKREFPIQLAEDTISYWTYINVSEFIGQTITLKCPATSKSLNRIYQDSKINGSDSLYSESNRPQFHFTVKRGWCNDINGPIFYNNQYHLFWQAFPFGLQWNTGYMYWGHAVSKDLVHWEELAPALMLDSLGSPWSGSTVVDKNNDGGWGKNALIAYYTAFDLVSSKQVQCIAYSTDNAKTFQRYAGNPIIDSNREMQTTHTRDPKVFWYEPSKCWVMVLFERDGMSFYNSIDMKSWKKQSHFEGLNECPDMFELPVDGNLNTKKWVLHGGSADYFIGTFDGKKFIPESSRLRYAEGSNSRWGDHLYAAQSFENMPDNRRVQIAWGRIDHEGMPFVHAMLFPTEFSLKTTPQGIRLVANPIKEIELLHSTDFKWSNLSTKEANEKLGQIKPGYLHAKLNFTLDKGKTFRLYYQGKELITVSSDDLLQGENFMEILIDKSIAEIFINHGTRYIVKQLNPSKNKDGLVFESDKDGPFLNQLEVFEMKSIWKGMNK